jgi:hypothetical protein
MRVTESLPVSATSLSAIPNRLQSPNDVLRHQAGLDVFALQLSRHRSKTPYYRSTTLTSAVAPHCPDVVVADRRGIVDDDLGSLPDARGGEQKELVPPLANPGIRFARVVEISPHIGARIEIGIRPEANTVRGK